MYLFLWRVSLRILIRWSTWKPSTTGSLGITNKDMISSGLHSLVSFGILLSVLINGTFQSVITLIYIWLELIICLPVDTIPSCNQFCGWMDLSTNSMQILYLSPGYPNIGRHSNDHSIVCINHGYFRWAFLIGCSLLVIQMCFYRL